MHLRSHRTIVLRSRQIVFHPRPFRHAPPCQKGLYLLLAKGQAREAPLMGTRAVFDDMTAAVRSRMLHEKGQSFVGQLVPYSGHFLEMSLKLCRGSLGRRNPALCRALSKLMNLFHRGFLWPGQPLTWGERSYW